MKNEVFETLTQRGFNNYLQIAKSLKAQQFQIQKVANNTDISN